MINTLARKLHPFVGYRGMFDCDCACAQAPNLQPTAAATEKAAELSYQAAQDDLAFRKQVYQDSLPRQKELEDLAARVANKQYDAMDQQMRFADDQKGYYDATYKPLEMQMVLQSIGGMDMSDDQLRQAAAKLGINPDEAVYSMALQRGAADNAAQRAMSQSRASANSAFAQQARNLTRMGGDANRIANAAATLASNQTLTDVQASNAAREGAYNKQIGLTAGAASFGRNMPNTAGQMYGLANSSGSSAVGNQNAGLMAGLPYANYMSGGYGSQLQAAGLAQQGALGLGGLQMQGYGIAQGGYNAQTAAGNGDMSGVAGAAIGIL